MKNYLDQIRQIDSEAFNNMPEQISIDIIQEIVQDITDSEENITMEDVGAWCYSVDILLEVYNPKFTHDIDLLTRLRDILHKWREDSEFVATALGQLP